MTTPLVSRVLEFTCWVCAVILLGTYVGGRALGELERREAVASFTSARTAGLTEPPGPSGHVEVAQLGHPATGAFRAHGDGDVDVLVAIPDQHEWSPARIRRHAEGKTDPGNAGSVPLAVLRIERIGLEVPVYADLDERNLNRGAGLVAGTAPLDSAGNIGIAAHRDGYFRALRHVIVGDRMELQSPSQRRSYRITDLWVVEPTDIWVLQETSEPAVTLVTCHPFHFVGNAPHRFIVRALAEQ